LEGIFERPVGALRYNQNQMSVKLGIRLGTSAFTAAGWPGTFYPTREAEARRGETQSRQAAARLNWRGSDQPAWLDEKTYREKIQPRLSEITVPIISSALASRNLTLPTFAQADAYRIQGIG
jgi:hypothetical protein